MKKVRKPQIRKELINPDIVRDAIKTQQRTAPVFFIENGMSFDLLTESIAVGQISRAMMHLNAIIKSGIQEDIDFHPKFISLIKQLKA